jgi:hypothetical protein
MDEEPFAAGGRLQQFEACWKKLDNQRVDKWFTRNFIADDGTGQGITWYYALPDGVVPDCGYEVIDFEGGLYASDIAVLGDIEDESRIYGAIKDWVNQNDLFELDERPGRYNLSSGVSPEWLQNAMGSLQLEIFVPIKLRGPSGRLSLSKPAV